MGKKYVFGADIGGTAVKVGLLDGEGNLLDYWQFPTRLEDQGAVILPDVHTAIDGILDVNHLDFSSVKGIGLAVPGPVTGEGFVPAAVNLGWKNYDVKKEMQRITGISNICVENDAKAAALGEYWKGGWEKFHSAVMITIGTAIGGAVILDGKVLRGAFGAAGELSHIQVNPAETVPCACGKYGHLQQYVSTDAILNSVKQRLSDSNQSSSLRLIDEISVKDIFDAAKAGDGIALESVEKMARLLARVMAMVSCVVDPELFIIGGGVSNAGEFLLDLLRKEFRKTALTMCENTRIEAAKTGSDAGIYGSAAQLIYGIE